MVLFTEMVEQGFTSRISNVSNLTKRSQRTEQFNLARITHEVKLTSCR